MRASARVGAKCYNKWERRCFSGLGIFGTFLGQLFHRLPSPARATPPKNRFQARTSSSSAPFKRSPRVTFARPRSQARLPITQHRPRTAASAVMDPSSVTALAAADKRGGSRNMVSSTRNDATGSPAKKKGSPAKKKSSPTTKGRERLPRPATAPGGPDGGRGA